MSLNLLDSFGKSGVVYNLPSASAQVTDTDYLSKYFVVSEFNSKFTAGKNSVGINGSPFLQQNSEILVECIDSAGNRLFIEMAKQSDVAARNYAYKESNAFVLSIHVYNDTADGVGQLILYGTLIDGRKVKWTRNITIDKTLKNVSKVRFYQRPALEVDSIEVPVLSTAISTNLITAKQFVGQLHGIAVDPAKDVNYPSLDVRNTDVDYRLVIDSPFIDGSTPALDSCNSQMEDSTVDLIINKIQSPFSINEIVPTQQSASFIIKNVYNNSTIQIADPYFFTDSKGNEVITNIVSASFTITYPFVSYNSATSSYLITNINGNISVVKTSFADISYKNLRAFSGFVARHKVYRKSLLSNADFTVVADEPLTINEILRDNLTQNKFYELLGKFYNQEHISRYWFTSSMNLNMTHSPDIYIDSVHITSPSPSTLNGTDYMMVKNDSVSTNRDAIYVPFDQDQFVNTSGSAYDSNFMQLRANVQYILQVDAVIEKDANNTDATLEFYFTSSQTAASQESNFTDQYGIKVGIVEADQPGAKQNLDQQIFFFTPKSDLYGTLVIVPKQCQGYLKNVSFRVYGDDGFSPDVFTTRIPWPISVANESFEIKAELFDINHNLVYANLFALQNFDPSGSSLIPFIPGGSGSIIPGTDDMFISGNLFVSKSIDVIGGDIILQVGNIFLPFIGTRPATASIISASRILSVRGDNGFVGEIVSNPIVDISHDDAHIFLSTGSLGITTIDHNNLANNPVATRKAIAARFDSGSGRRIYYVAGTKVIETGSFS